MNLSLIILFALAGFAFCGSLSGDSLFEGRLKTATTFQDIEDAVISERSGLGDALWEMSYKGNIPIRDNKYLMYCFIRKILSIKSEMGTELISQKNVIESLPMELKKIRDEIETLTSEIARQGKIQRLLSKKSHELSDLSIRAQNLDQLRTKIETLQKNSNKLEAFASRFSLQEKMDKLAALDEVSDEIANEPPTTDKLHAFENSLRKAKTYEEIERSLRSSLGQDASVLKAMVERTRYYKIPITSQSLSECFFRKIISLKSSYTKNFALCTNIINTYIQESSILQVAITKLGVDLKSPLFDISGSKYYRKVRHDELIWRKSVCDREVIPYQNDKNSYQMIIRVLDAFLDRFYRSSTFVEEHKEP